MTKQETFDTVVRGIIDQGGPSRLEKPINQSFLGACSCAYRGVNGRKCAAGQLISDDKYKPTMEGWGAESEYVRYALADHDLSLVHALQNVHDRLGAKLDDVEFLVQWRTEVAKVGQSWGLSMRVLEVQP